MENNCLNKPEAIPYKYRDDFVTGMAYVPWQHFGNVYEPHKGFTRGTIFPDLDKPFEGRCVR